VGALTPEELFAERIADSEARSVEHILPGDSNSLGNAFGGHIVSLMDKLAAFCAWRFSQGVVVTASIDKLEFGTPIRMGDFIELVAKVESVGRTSIRVRVDVYKVTTTQTVSATSGLFIMVAIGADGKPVAVRERISFA
jgi:acyl-CoA thioesterase YciA